MSKPNVVFVLGGPGAGKGTECAKLVDEFGFVHLSAGDLLREERKNGGEKGELINNYIKEGKIIPVAITIGLLDVAMKKAGAGGKDKFLIDGFPRNADNLSGWNEMMKDVCDVRFCLYMECNEEAMQKRLLGRDQGRADDNLEAIKKRFATYHESTMPIIKTFEKEGLLRQVDSSKTPEEVHNACKEIFAEFKQNTKPYCVVAHVLIKEERVEEFLKIIKADAEGSVATEEGCLRFDVLQDPKNKLKFVFVEVYKDEPAFQVHMKAPHFLPWMTFCGEAGSETLSLIHI